MVDVALWAKSSDLILEIYVLMQETKLVQDPPNKRFYA